MSANAADYFIKTTPNFSTTIGGGGVASGATTTIPLTSVSNLPTDTAIELVINRVNSSGTETNDYETVRGVISGSNLSSTVRGVEGTAQAWAAGIVVEYLVTSDIQNRMVTGTLLALEQTGRIKTEQWYAADSVGTDAYAVTLSPVPTAYTTGMEVNFKAGTANTGAATLNVNALGAKTIKKLHDVDLADNDIEVGQIVTVVYDGTNFQMQSQVGNASISQNQTELYAADAQANDTYVITLSPAPSAYVTGQTFRFKANTANTGAATLNVNSLGAKTIKKFKDVDLSDNDIKASQIVEVVYDGTNFELLSTPNTAGVAAIFSASSGTYSSGGTNYIYPCDLSTPNSTESNRSVSFPAMTLKSIKFKISANTLNNNLVVTVRKNSADTGLTKTVATTVTGDQVVTTDVSVAANDTIDIKLDTTAAGSGSATITSMVLTYQFNS